MQRLVQFENAEARETPRLLLGALRVIDPTIELVYPGEGRWWLGAVRRTDERERRAQTILAQQESLDEVKRNPRTIRLAQLNLQGFALIEAYHGADPSGVMTVDPGPSEYRTTILDDFAERDAAWRRDGGEAVVMAKLSAPERERLKRSGANLDAYTMNDGRDHYRREVRNRVTFGYGGMTGGAGRIILPSAAEPLITGL